MTVEAGEIGLILGVSAPLVGMIYAALVVRIQKIEDTANDIREKHVTKEFFEREMKHQDKALERIERHLGTTVRPPERSRHD